MRIASWCELIACACLAAMLQSSTANTNWSAEGVAAVDTKAGHSELAALPALTILDVSATSAAPSIEIAVGAPSGETAENDGECFLVPACIDRYLWSVYQRAPKVDTIRVSEPTKVTIKRNGKSRVVTKIVTKFVDEDFTWKDPEAARKADMSVDEYVIGGMERDFKARLYRLVRALDDAGLAPGITSGFRDDYRQSIATGKKAATNGSYHGGSLRGGYGHGRAVDLVSVRGETRSERMSSSEALWKWVDAQGIKFGLGRPYLDKDPPHVGPIDGREYANHRGIITKQAAMETK